MRATLGAVAAWAEVEVVVVQVVSELCVWPCAMPVGGLGGVTTWLLMVCR